MLGGPIKVSRSEGLPVYSCVHVCVCLHTCMSVFMHASNTLHSLAYVHTVCVCVCLSTHIFVCAHVWVCVCAWCHLFVSGSGHIHVFISVPSGQICRSCLLKRDNIQSTKLRTTICICRSVHRTTTSSCGSEHKIIFYSCYIINNVEWIKGVWTSPVSGAQENNQKTCI